MSKVNLYIPKNLLGNFSWLNDQSRSVLDQSCRAADALIDDEAVIGGGGGSEFAIFLVTAPAVFGQVRICVTVLAKNHHLEKNNVTKQNQHEKE